ncbi:fatty acyl-AMP ligase [Priestia megaterium]|uniref:fatty acyl-AMP ligase n=1 Tax=Priestia megaterium TaxID=1404 RepID=UPI000BF48260|nr:fatty acyl-AMP ligase [Priestia megaterium]MBZ5482863.1 fatty acyl-AMP ligase [Bacillus sp. T_4]PET66216.1 AMP-binding protein [Priestia megaterium]PFK81878.1 AMP-binding protein [Priestia megaterium]
MEKLIDNPTILNSNYSSMIDLLSHKAMIHPEKVVYTFLSNDNQDETNITYQELHMYAQQIAAYLQHLGLEGQRALLMYPSGIDYVKAFLGCIYANVTPVPVYPPGLSRNMERLKAIMDDSATNIILTTTQLHSKISFHFSDELSNMNLKWIPIDDISHDHRDQWSQPKVDKESLAFLQYTSGSTSSPKGVMVTHGNILHNEAMIKAACQHNEDTVMLGWLPMYHDMGLIGNILQPLYLGAKCVFMSPMDFLQKPFRWLSAISKYKATISGGPNFAYDLCLKKITDEQKMQLDLSSWEVAFNGAEPVRYETIQKFARAFKDCDFKLNQFFPCYGMAEATLFITGNEKLTKPVSKGFCKESLLENKAIERPINSEDSVKLVGCGMTWLDQKVEIVNTDSLSKCALNEIGEIWVKGDSIAKGYFGREQETNYAFNNTVKDTNENGFLRTGDLGFFHEGQLFVTGRLKDVIVLRGKNHYPQDIELTVEKADEAIISGASAAFSVDINGEEKLIIVAEIERKYRPRPHKERELKGYLDNVLRSIRQQVMEEHEVQPYSIYLLKTSSIPKTSSGKIQRRACKNAYLNNGLEVWHN